MNVVRFTSCFLLAAFVWVAGCATQSPDPVAGWKFCYSDNPIRSNKAVIDDYQDYIRNLPHHDRQFVGSINSLEDGTGQHAITIQEGINGTYWIHVLIYDKDNKRIKVIKYKDGGYRS
jgi:hypothetical protein